MHSGTAAARAIRSALLVVAAMPCIALSLWLGASPMKAVMLGAQSGAWPSVQGLVVLSRVLPSGRKRNAVPEVNYAYVVNDRQYTGATVQFGNVGGSEEWAKHVVSLYPIGPARVFYQPDDPKASVLIPGSIRPLTYMGVAVSLFFALGGVYCLGKAYSQLRNAP
jgi:Protein of unknown function (DUF3592)